MGPMGLIITGANGTIPRQITLRLECDQPTEMFCRGFADFIHTDGFVAAHSAAMRAGWLERHTDSGRVWLCPECSGKGKP